MAGRRLFSEVESIQREFESPDPARRRRVLHDTIASFEQSDPRDRIHRLAKRNLDRWRAAVRISDGKLRVEVAPDDWGARFAPQGRRIRSDDLDFLVRQFRFRLACVFAGTAPFFANLACLPFRRAVFVLWGLGAVGVVFSESTTFLVSFLLSLVAAVTIHCSSAEKELLNLRAIILPRSDWREVVERQDRLARAVLPFPGPNSIQLVNVCILQFSLDLNSPS